MVLKNVGLEHISRSMAKRALSPTNSHCPLIIVIIERNCCKHHL